jgi:hypothetical protein
MDFQGGYRRLIQALGQSLEGRRRTTKNRSRYIRWPGQDSNRAPPEYIVKQEYPHRGPPGCIMRPAATFVNFTYFI